MVNLEKVIRSLQMSEIISGKMKEPLEKILEYLKDHAEITNVVGQKMTGKSTALVMLVLLKVTKEQKKMCI